MKYLILATLVFVSIMATGQSTDTLRVKVSNIEEIKGAIMMAVYDKEELFMGKEAVASARVPVENHEQWIAFDNLTYGEYAVITYHDVNGNGELDTNFFKIPKEPYGFSNVDGGWINIPSYKKSRFDFTKQKKSIEIALK